jgi:hypothetical protein
MVLLNMDSVINLDLITTLLAIVSWLTTISFGPTVDSSSVLTLLASGFLICRFWITP